jgi:hypothetical protein
MRRGVSGQEQRDKAKGTGMEGKGREGTGRSVSVWGELARCGTNLYRIIPYYTVLDQITLECSYCATVRNITGHNRVARREEEWRGDNRDGLIRMAMK